MSSYIFSTDDSAEVFFRIISPQVWSDVPLRLPPPPNDNVTRFLPKVKVAGAEAVARPTEWVAITVSAVLSVDSSFGRLAQSEPSSAIHVTDHARRYILNAHPWTSLRAPPVAAGNHGQRFPHRGLFSCPMLQRQVVNLDGTRPYRCPVQSKFAVTRPPPEEPTVRTALTGYPLATLTTDRLRQPASDHACLLLRLIARRRYNGIRVSGVWGGD